MPRVLFFLEWIKVPIVYIFLLRFPILCLLFIAAFRWIALRLKPDLLANIFDVDGPGMLPATLMALLSSWAIFLTGWIIYAYGPLRFHVGTWEAPGAPPVWGYALGAIPGLICLSGAFAYSPKQNPSRRPLGLWLGFAGGLVIGLSLLACMRVVGADVSIVLPITDYLARAFAALGSSGYVDTNGHLFPEHCFAIVLFLLSLLVYAVLGLFKRSRRGRPSGVPTIAYLLLLTMLAAWVLPALSFALDPYHVPVLIALIGWLVIVSRSPQTDHFFNTRPISYHRNSLDDAEQRAPSPAEVLAFPQNGKVILIAASGGGIQAAAWTARVLTGLEEKSKGKFARAIRLISSVSGGSVGSMFFCGRYTQTGELAQLEEIVKDAEASSLEDVSWGLAYPDLLRVLFPALCWKFGGRGRALERAWTHTTQLEESLGVGLSTWFRSVREGNRPANIFNATFTETGDRLLFSTTYLPVGKPATPPARWDFHQFYLNEQKNRTLDVAVVTAARMSATFPYVTPAARPDAGGPETAQLHVVDGGYFDNYGMDTLLEWLDDGLTTLQKTQPERYSKLQVMIVEIHEAPDPHRLVPPHVRKKRSWFFQTYAPLTTLFAVRTSGQRSHNQVDLGLMMLKWRDKIQHTLFEFGTPDPTARIDSDKLKSVLSADSSIKSKTGRPVQLDSSSSLKEEGKLQQAADPPLSWHLTERQKENIESEWQIQSVNNQAQAVAEFLA
jgi:hypothetical protein